MSKQKHSHSQGVDSAMTAEFQHILIPACALGADVYREFRAANPKWRPESYIHGSQNGKCPGCLECNAYINKQVIVKTHLTMEDSGPMKVGSPISISFANAINSPTENTVSFKEIEGSSVMIRPHGTTSDEPTVMKICIKPVLRGFTGNDSEPQTTASTRRDDYAGGSKIQHIGVANHTKAITRDDYVGGSKTQLIGVVNHTKATTRDDHVGGCKTQHIGVANLARMKVSVAPNGMDAESEPSSSSEEISESTSMETGSFPEHGVGFIQGDMSTISRFADCSPLRGDAPIHVDDQALFDFVVATRKIPYGQSFSTMDAAMQRKLHDHFKTSCPPCPHCNCNMYVKFRYFNNSGKSSLLQPRYTCRNPDTCVTIQEKSGKAGSRDFTLPRSKEVEPFPGGQGMQGEVVRQPQLLPRSGHKRPSHELDTPCEAGDRSAKLPNTTLTLQNMNGSGPTTDMSKMQMVELSKDRRPKTAEDSNSSSSTHIASDWQTATNARCEAEPSSENDRQIVQQPIGIQRVETGTADRTSKGKIAELNICMYIDLSSATSSC